MKCWPSIFRSFRQLIGRYAALLFEMRSLRLRIEKVRVIPQSHDSFLSGMALYGARLDKGYSLTDCVSMAAMRREGLSDVLTNDKHFEQEGFRALFRP